MFIKGDAKKRIPAIKTRRLVLYTIKLFQPGLFLSKQFITSPTALDKAMKKKCNFLTNSKSLRTTKSQNKKFFCSSVVKLHLSKHNKPTEKPVVINSKISRNFLREIWNKSVRFIIMLMCKSEIIKDKIYKVNAIIINNLLFQKNFVKAYVIGVDQKIIYS